MYLQGTLSIDPSQLTRVVPERPTKAFKRMLYMLTAGAVNDKREHETFCAVALLQNLNRAFRSLGITNVVRLSKDEVDFYLDEEGREDDMKEALEQFSLEVDRIESTAFQTLTLVLEHEDEQFKYLIALNVERIHAVGTYPIHIEIDGLMKDFRSKGEQGPQLKARMSAILNSQEAYDEMVTAQRRHFNQFLGSIAMAMKKFVRLDDVTEKTVSAMLRPKGEVGDSSAIKIDRRNPRPIFHGYYGTSEDFFYAWLWADMVHDLNYHVCDFHLIDEAGATIMEVGETGFDAGVDALNVEADFALPDSGDITLGTSDVLPSVTGTGDGGGWLSESFSGGDSGDIGGSSCSSCGSSCGGCGGD